MHQDLLSTPGRLTSVIMTIFVYLCLMSGHTFMKPAEIWLKHLVFIFFGEEDDMKPCSTENSGSVTDSFEINITRRHKDVIKYFHPIV